MAEPKRIQYCSVCKRIKGIGCACNLSFIEKVRTVALTLPGSFRAVK
jgi:hypothetical protein